MKISILHPSYGRPEIAFKTAIKWMNECGYPDEPIEYIICVAETDRALNEYKRLFRLPFKLVVYPTANMVKQMNHAATLAKGDLFVCISDDFDCAYHWSDRLTFYLNGKRDFIVKTVDGIQPDIITLPIMDRTYYKRFNFIYNPEYNHFYGDEELFEVGRNLGKLIELPIVFEHIHYTAGKAKKDATNIKNSIHFAGDRATFQKRKAANFP